MVALREPGPALQVAADPVGGGSSLNDEWADHAVVPLAAAAASSRNVAPRRDQPPGVPAALERLLRDPQAHAAFLGEGTDEDRLAVFARYGVHFR